MSLTKKITAKYIVIFLISIFSQFTICQPETVQEPRINKIVLVRKNKNSYLTNDLILNTIPYKEGEIFKPNKTSKLIHNLYDLSKPYSFFKHIQVLGEVLDNNLMNLYVITYEKDELKDVIINGAKHLLRKDIDEKLKFENIHAINEIDLKKIVSDIRKMYIDKDYHLVQIDAELKKDGDKVSVVINIDENKKSLVQRVFFKGNCNISSKRLRNVIFTREDWILGFLNKAGSYRQENLDQDRYFIENYYKSHGYFLARVIDTELVMDPKTKQYNVTFTIEEGDLYTIKDVSAQGNDIVSEEMLLNALPIKPGNLYSTKDVRDSIEILRTIWGQYGYVFADIEPILIPDEKNKTISLTFNTEFGDKVFVNKINILGNKKTKDHVIRRKLTVEEGELLTTTKMDDSKERVQNLGFFDPQNGVNWKINRIDDQWAELDMLLNETKTGRVGFNMGVGGSPTNLQSMTQSFKFGGSIYDSNLFGEGILLKLDGEWSREEWTLAFNLTDPWFTHRPIYTELDFFVTKSRYTEEFRNISDFTERVVGGFVGAGYATSFADWFNETGIKFKFGVEDIQQSNRPTPAASSDEFTEQSAQAMQLILNRRFQNGTIISLSNRIVQDIRNHTMHASSGYQWSLNTQVGLPGWSGNMGFAKLEAEGTVYTPLIGENTLVFGLHGFFGIVGNLKNNIIPYRELFHIGGPASVRGYLFGQIGPSFLGDSIGGKKAFFINAELMFPITKDFAIKGAVFYDGGAGWDTPDLDRIPEGTRDLLRNNRFQYRQAIGFGVRMLRPTPMKVDWGFKLDKRKGEKASELHLSAYRDF